MHCLIKQHSHMTRLWAGQHRHHNLIPGRGQDIFSSPKQWVWGALSLRIRWPQHESDHSPPASDQVKNDWSYTPFPHDFMVCTEKYIFPLSYHNRCFILHRITVLPGHASLCLLLSLHQTASFNALHICSCIPDPTGWHPLWFPLQAVDLIDELMIRPVCIIVDDDHVKEVAIFIFHFTSLFNYVFEFILLKCLSTPYFLLPELF